MIAERIDCNATHFRIFTGEIVFRDERLDLIAHGLVDCDLTCDRGTTRRFRTTTSFKYCATIARCNATQLSRTFAPR
jgi:hypothetical protein